MTQTKNKPADHGSEKGTVARADPTRRFFDWFGLPSWASRFEGMDFFDDRMVRVEEFEDDATYVVRAEMPDLDPDKDIDVHVSDHTLHIEAKRTEKHESKDKDRYHSEFRYGRFVRNLALPRGADAKDVKATYRDGILEVRMPVSKEAEADTKVPVHRT